MITQLSGVASLFKIMEPVVEEDLSEPSKSVCLCPHLTYLILATLFLNVSCDKFLSFYTSSIARNF